VEGGMERQTYGKPERVKQDKNAFARARPTSVASVLAIQYVLRRMVNTIFRHNAITRLM
jgi:hypothetical protein